MSIPFDIPGVVGEWKWDEGDPEELFFLEEEIAAGAFGTVYKGIHNVTGEVAAVKITQAEGDDEISDYIELTVLRKCNHPNIIKFFGCWRKGVETFMALEYCGGGAISEFYQVWDIPWTEEQIAYVCRESLKGLLYMHQQGLIHRDIKGGNILVTSGGDIKLIDFGVSAILTEPDQKRNTLIGTPFWMAPEVIANKTRPTPYTQAVDVWSIGITAIELAEKDPPLSQMNPMRALMQIPLRSPPKLAEPEKWSADFANFLEVCLDKEPKKRATIEQLLNHPFVNKPGLNRKIMLPLIQKATEEKARILAEEFGEDYESKREELLNAQAKQREREDSLREEASEDASEVSEVSQEVSHEVSQEVSQTEESVNDNDSDSKDHTEDTTEELHQSSRKKKDKAQTKKHDGHKKKSDKPALADLVPVEQGTWGIEELTHAASVGSDITVFRQKLSQLHGIVNSTNSNGQTPLFCAASRGNADHLFALLKVPGIDFHKGDTTDKSSPLHGAAREQHGLVSGMLIWMGTDLSIRNSRNAMPHEEAKGDAAELFSFIQKEGVESVPQKYPDVLQLRIFPPATKFPSSTSVAPLNLSPQDPTDASSKNASPRAQSLKLSSSSVAPSKLSPRSSSTPREGLSPRKGSPEKSATKEDPAPVASIPSRPNLLPGGRGSAFGAGRGEPLLGGGRGTAFGAGRGAPLEPLGRGRGVPPGGQEPMAGSAEGRGRGINRQASRRPQHLKTAQQQELQEAKVANQKLMMKQMEALRAQSKKNEQELEKARLKDLEKESAIVKKHVGRLNKLKATNATVAAKAVKQQETDLAAHEKKHLETAKVIRKQVDDRLKTVTKEHKDNNSVLLSDFKKETREMSREENTLHKEAEKRKEAEIKQLPKKERTFEKKQQRQRASEHVKQLAERHEQRAIRWNMILKENAMRGEHDSNWLGVSQVFNENIESVKERQQAELNFQDLQRSSDLAAREEQYNLELEHYQQFFPIELANLDRQQELEVSHMREQQAFEKEQQEDLFDADYRVELRELNKKKLAEEKALKASIKQYKKENSKKMSKDELKTYEYNTTNDWENKQAIKLDEWMAKQSAQREEEKNLLLAHHENLQGRLKVALAEARAEKVRSQNELTETLKREFQEDKERMEQEYWTKRLEMVRRHNKEKADITVTHLKETEIPLAAAQIAAHVALLESFVAEIASYQADEDLPTVIHDDIVTSLTAFFTENINKSRETKKLLEIVHEEEITKMKELHTAAENRVVLTAPVTTLVAERQLLQQASRPENDQDIAKDVKSPPSPSKESPAASVATQKVEEPTPSIDSPVITSNSNPNLGEKKKEKKDKSSSSKDKKRSAVKSDKVPRKERSEKSESEIASKSDSRKDRTGSSKHKEKDGSEAFLSPRSDRNSGSSRARSESASTEKNPVAAAPSGSSSTLNSSSPFVRKTDDSSRFSSRKAETKAAGDVDDLYQ
eukprot:TRINITY_DN4980_c0_g1_i1.p1 TRINITY_DN4980_c0_g1~~TRINITY_DN4980_c0_g1_i1.p1  ORF type:complete len:1461 (+),score=442.57 TRINITY_DN4980_c0_g1_i1:40-4422(+)